MSIMEKNLPVADSIASGDKVRIVTSGGSSKQIDASAIGGGGGSENEIFITLTYDSDSNTYSCDKTNSEIDEALGSGKSIKVFLNDDDKSGGYYFTPLYVSASLVSQGASVSDITLFFTLITPNGSVYLSAFEIVNDTVTRTMYEFQITPYNP